MEEPIKHSEGKLFYEIDWDFVDGIAERMQSNKKNGKYPRWNWTRKLSKESFIDLVQAKHRHHSSIMKGVLEDDSEPFGHLFADVTNSMMILYQIKNFPEHLETLKNKLRDEDTHTNNS